MHFCSHFLTIFSSVVWYCLFFADSTTCKFSEIHVRNRTTNFTFLTSCLEIDNKFEMKMKYRSTVTDTFVTQLERVGQFIQDTATVTIVQGISVTKYTEREEGHAESYCCSCRHPAFACILHFVSMSFSTTNPTSFNFHSCIELLYSAAVGQEETFNNVSMDDVQMCVKMKTTYDTCECQSRSCLKKGTASMFIVTAGT